MQPNDKLVYFNRVWLFPEDTNRTAFIATNVDDDESWREGELVIFDGGERIYFDAPYHTQEAYEESIEFLSILQSAIEAFTQALITQRAKLMAEENRKELEAKEHHE